VLLVPLMLAGAPRAEAERPVGEQLLDIAHLWSNEIGTGVGAMTFDLVELSFDVRKGVTRLSIGGGSDDLALPEFDVTSHTIYGERAVVVRVPIFEGKF